MQVNFNLLIIILLVYALIILVFILNQNRFYQNLIQREKGATSEKDPVK